MAANNIKEEKTIFIEGAGIEFLPEPLFINDSDRVEIFRMNLNGISPYMKNNIWPDWGKAARVNNGYGIYGMSPGSSNGISYFFGFIFSSVYEKKQEAIQILRLEVDRKKILYQDNYEIAFSECNIVGNISPSEFINCHFPDYKDTDKLIDFYGKALQDPETHKERFKIYFDELFKKFTMQRHKAQDDFGRMPDEVQKRERDNMRTNLNGIKNFATLCSRPSGIHGVSHWENVARNGVILAKKTGASLPVVRIFGWVHDMCRENDGGIQNTDCVLQTC